MTWDGPAGCLIRAFIAGKQAVHPSLPIYGYYKD